MMIDKATGALALDSGYIFLANMSFEDFKSSEFYNTKMTVNRQFWLDKPLEIDDRLFYVGLLFKNGMLSKIKLQIYVPGIDNQHEIKKIHDDIVDEENISSKYPWGYVVSVYDSKSVLSTINVNYLK